MDIHYDILVDEAEGRGKEHLDSFIFSKSKALRILREQRTRYPAAYLVKVVETRCREKKAQ